jgi:hypothetical protein
MIQNGLVAAEASPPTEPFCTRHVQIVQNISATAGLSVNDNLNQMSLMLFENFIKR